MSTSPIDFEIKLHEDGETVDLLYGANAPNPGDGRGATIGIEDAAGSDALEFSFGEALLTPNSAYRFEIVPVAVPAEEGGRAGLSGREPDPSGAGLGEEVDCGRRAGERVLEDAAVLGLRGAPRTRRAGLERADDGGGDVPYGQLCHDHACILQA